MSMERWRLRWLFNRRVGLTLLWAMLLLVMAIAANLVGIRLAGSIEAWQHWMAAHSNVFLAWRLLLYAGTAWAWLWMRRRLRAREPDGASGQRLLRVEIGALTALVALEGTLLMQAE